MSEKTRERMQKFVELCDSGKPWYVFLGLFSALLAANLAVQQITGQRMKWWAWVMDIAGIASSLKNIYHCKKLKAERAAAEAENDAE